MSLPFCGIFWACSKFCTIRKFKSLPARKSFKMLLLYITKHSIIKLHPCTPFKKIWQKFIAKIWSIRQLPPWQASFKTPKICRFWPSDSLWLRRGVSPWAWPSRTVFFTIDSAFHVNPSSLSIACRVSPWAWPSKTVCFTIDSAPHLIPSSNPFSFPIVFLQYGPASVAMQTSRRIHYDCVAVCLREHRLLEPCFLQ